jgi:hypothetical protein
MQFKRVSFAHPDMQAPKEAGDVKFHARGDGSELRGYRAARKEGEW